MLFWANYVIVNLEQVLVQRWNQLWNCTSQKIQLRITFRMRTIQWKNITFNSKSSRKTDMCLRNKKMYPKKVSTLCYSVINVCKTLYLYKHLFKFCCCKICCKRNIFWCKIFLINIFYFTVLRFSFLFHSSQLIWQEF